MIVYWLLLCVVACERVAELVVSGRHARHPARAEAWSTASTTSL
ncbi:MAG TPA: hypothetical protein VKH61_01695 [Streptosporangiaceae bacterium]|nr:hypothetical protein [Streptosporangiaceae bacterium]